MQQTHRTLSTRLLLLLAAAASPLLGCHGKNDPATRGTIAGFVSQAVPLSPTTKPIPAPLSEFRGIWVASVENINWPSKPGLSTAQQKAELIALLDRCVEGRFNAILLQVRPCADAFYKSDLEPWSFYLTGEIGKAPSPFYDPLEFACTEAHARGLELHAWINPFRVKQAGSKATPESASLKGKHPEYVRTYGRLQWMDPGDPAARAQSLAVVNDIVKRYDVDGVHIDDYFYPYKQQDPATKKELDFPDAETFAKYGAGKSKGDFRRAAIDDFVQKMYEQTKATKPHVKVGISPFGIWRPGNPPQIKGFDSYGELYGDSLKWLREGWADYFTPQLYWSISQTPQSFPVLLAWWQSQNTKGRHLWPGLYSTKTDGNSPAWRPTEIEYQIQTSRGLTPPFLPQPTYTSPGETTGLPTPPPLPKPGPTTYPAYPGTIHFSATFLGTGKDKKGPFPLYEHLRKTTYAEQAPLPATPWLATNEPAPGTPENLTAQTNPTGGLTLSWSAPTTLPEAVTSYVLQYSLGTAPITWHQLVILPTPNLPLATTATIPHRDPTTLALYSTDHLGRLSAPLALAPPAPTTRPSRRRN